ncbi:MAG: hypothetical protein LBN30_03725 [Oscillospiraceae bacterium]|jgi:hypothetical protein|nr:hypothetical protein [Oscillospiraceae bacterium]
MTYEELAQRHSDINGFESAEWEGWYHIEDKMFSGIKSVLDKYSIPLQQFVLEQEKEKFGELRTYWCWFCDDNPDDYNKARQEISAVIDNASTESAKTCCYCGEPATLQSRGWILPYCQACAEEQEDYPTGFTTNFM